ncbi:MAG: nucleotidyltransferase family protein, partial [Gemmatimonadales bacterium]
MSAPTADVGSAVIDRSREIEIFQLAARTELGEASETRLGEVVSGPVDWDYVLETGGLHGILPLLQLHLERRETVPAPVRQALQERCERVVRSNLYLSSQLVEIAGALDHAGVSNLALKGPAVAVTLYGSLFLREFGDLDLLVKSEDVARATRVVESQGFAPWLSVSGAQEDVLQHVEYSRTFTRSADDLDLDLHWDLARNFFRGRVEAGSLWADTSSFALHGHEVNCLPSDLQLLELCVHGAKHGPRSEER